MGCFEASIHARMDLFDKKAIRLIRLEQEFLVKVHFSKDHYEWQRRVEKSYF